MDYSSLAALENVTDELDGQCKRELGQQIVLLQDAVAEMKTAFVSALQQLRSIPHEDQALQEQVEQNKTECQNQTAEVIKIILSLQAEFGTVKCQLQQIQDTQSRVQQQIQCLCNDQDLLLDELHKSASVTDQFRRQFNSSRQWKSTSGSQSNDSGVALLLEKAQAGVSLNGFPMTSDQDSSSIPETSPVLVSSMVHDYVAGLGQSTFSNYDLESDINYDSDSSLVVAANKSLHLSSSLGKHCYFELRQAGLSEEETEERGFESLIEEKDKILPSLSSDFFSGPGLVDKDYLPVFNKKKPTNSTADKLRSLVQETHIRETHRLQICKTMLEMERKYCRKLWILQDIYMETFRRNGILCQNDFNTLFPEEIFKLYEKHCIVLHKLEERIQAWKWHGVLGDILLKFINADEFDVLHLYTSYVNEFPEVLKIFYKLCRQSDRFTKFLKEQTKHPICQGSDLTDFLLMPVQRIPTYIIQLKHLLKYTPFEHPDYAHVTSCLNRLRDFLARLNDSMDHSFQLISPQVYPQSEFSHPLTSSKQSNCLTTPKPSIQEMDSFGIGSCISSDDESSIQGDSAIQWQMKLYHNNCKDIKSRERIHYRKHRPGKGKFCGSHESLKSSAMANKDSRRVYTAESNATYQASSTCSLSPIKSPVQPSSPNSVVSSTTLGNYDAGMKEESIIQVRHEDSFREDYIEANDLDDNDSIFNDKFTLLTSSELLNNCQKINIETSLLDSVSDSLKPKRNFQDDSCINNDTVNPEVKISQKSLPSSFLYANHTSHYDQELTLCQEKLLVRDLLSSNDGDNLNKLGNNQTRMDETYLCKKAEMGNKGSASIEVHHTSSADLISLQTGPVRPLIKAHSSHAVHQLLKEQNRMHLDGICKGGTYFGDQMQRKEKSKHEKKRVTLRSLKSIFSRKRNLMTNMKTVDMGTCTSNDELQSANLAKSTSDTSA